jgi:CheY-like chemotaxis protein
VNWVETIMKQWREDAAHFKGHWQPHILVADDESHIRESFKRVLQTMDCVVDEAIHGRDVLDQFERKCNQRCPPWDLIFLDLLMPVMRGDEALAVLKRRCPRIPVVIVTAYADSDMLTRAAESGYVGLITKPFSALQLRDTLAAHRLDRASVEHDTSFKHKPQN